MSRQSPAAVRVPRVAARRSASSSSTSLDTIRARRSSCTGSPRSRPARSSRSSSCCARARSSKEVYVLRRLHAAEAEGDAGLGLHFDLTVPFARYVLENAGQLEFPFRRYQIQKVWRGERPQEGRYREFVQADIDVVDRDTLPFHYEVEVALVIAEALRARCRCPPVTIQVNNRKLAEGFFRGVGAADPAAALRAIDKLDKIGPDGVRRCSTSEAGLSRRRPPGVPGAGRDPRPRTRRSSTRSARSASRDPLLDEGLEELVRVVEGGADVAPGPGRGRPADRPRARLLHRHRLRDPAARATSDLGSVCSGGRYDALAVRRPHHVPRGRHLASASRASWAGCSGRGLVRASRPVPDLRAGRGRRRGGAGGVRPGRRRRCGPAGSRARWRRRRPSSASRSGTPTGAASRTSGSRADGSVKDIRSGEQVPGRPRGPGSRRPRTCARPWRPPSTTPRSSTRDPHPRGRHPARRRRRLDRHPGRLGGPPPRPRRGRLPRPARRVRRRAGRGPRPGGRARPARRVLPARWSARSRRGRRATRTRTSPPATSR